MSSTRKPVGYWTKEIIHEIAKKYIHRSDFEAEHPAAYKKASTERWLDDILSHTVPKVVAKKPAPIVYGKTLPITEKKKKELESLVGVEYGSYKVISYEGFLIKGKDYSRHYFKHECKYCGFIATPNETHVKRNIKREIPFTCNKCKESVNIHTNQKKCSCCNTWKDANADNFPLSKNRPFGIHYYCLDCHLKKNRKFRTIPGNRAKEYDQKKQRLKTDNFYKMTMAIRNNIKAYVLKNGYTKKSRTHEILGCDFQFFREHIEAKFVDGMTWDNHGEWHFDHKIPISTAKTYEDLVRLCHYTNYQPLWKFDNISKGNKLDYVPDPNRITK